MGRLQSDVDRDNRIEGKAMCQSSVTSGRIFAPLLNEATSLGVTSMTGQHFSSLKAIDVDGANAGEGDSLTSGT